MTDKPSKAEKRRQRQDEKAQASKAKSVKFSSSMESLATKTAKVCNDYLASGLSMLYQQ